MDLGAFSINLYSVVTFFSQSPEKVAAQLLALGGWIIFAYLLFYALLHFFEDYKQDLYKHHWKYVVLAIDIPALNVQTPKAVEQMFSHLAGAFNKPDLKERLHEGFKQRWFSFEIISMEGYIQFLVWTEESFRDLVEAAVYAQYPDAEITEVEDYVNTIPQKYPNATYDVWIADFGLAEGNTYPIRCYQEFEHSISKDTVLKDSMGTFLESFSRIGPGEQMWFQIVVEPIGNDWKEDTIKKIKEIIGEKSHAHLNIVDHAVAGFNKLLVGVGDQVFGREASESHHEDDSGPKNQIQYLTPGTKTLVEAMEAKIAKLGFKTKMRAVYSGRKEVFNPTRGVHALIGAINQYNIPSSNSLIPTVVGKGTSSKGLRRKNLLMKAYGKRKIKTGGKSFILNIEELATVWHFPMSHVKTPLVQKAMFKQAEPPAGLPVERGFSSVLGSPHESLDTDTSASSDAQRPRSFTTDSGEVVEYD